MSGYKVFYSVCLDDIKEVLQTEYEIDFDGLTKDEQQEVIEYAVHGLESLDWYQALDCGLEGIADKLTEESVRFQVVVKDVDKVDIVVGTFDSMDLAISAQNSLKENNDIASRIVKKERKTA